MTFAFYEQVLDNLPDGITIQDKNFNIIYQNKAMKHAFGEHVGMKCYAIYERRDEVCEGCGVQKAFQTGEANMVLRTAFEVDGKTSYWENACFPLFDTEGNTIAGVEVCRNITDRVSLEEEVKDRNIELGQLNKQLKNKTTQLMSALTQREVAEQDLRKEIEERMRAEEELRESEEKFDAMLWSIGDHMSMMDKDLNIIWANETAKKVFGNDIIGKKCFEAYHRRKEPCEPYPCITLKAFQDGEAHEHDTQVMGQDGRIIYFHCTANVALRDKEGKPTAVIEISRNTTESKQVEETLQKSHDELEQTLRRLKETQTQMLQSEKMASIGQLAAGVAHEINNPTGFVSSNLKTLLDYQDDISTLIKQYRSLAEDLKGTMATGEYLVAISEQLERIADLEAEVDIDFVLNDISDLVKESREGTERIKKIVLDLKDFAHPGDQELKYADINRNLDSTLNVVWNELKYKATVTKDYGDLPEVRCYPQQLNQVFVNILVNAAQAIKKQGEIKITTGALDGKVEINISDTGKGIPEENLSKIFDPFFTTKEVGKGTGLGLNLAYNIVKKHKGTIDVESTVGVGTTFTIRIPVDGH